ncbi:MAG: hypothetical protein IJ155_07435 [Prevotella sp.]|nr:hypothetical protein [Prevotella sp.]
MEEKRYPDIEEEQGTGLCREPAVEYLREYETVTTRRPEGTVGVHDWIDDIDWDRLPILGPKTSEEAIARIEQAEKDLDDPTKWVTSEQMWAELHQKFPWLR